MHSIGKQENHQTCAQYVSKKIIKHVHNM